MKRLLCLLAALLLLTGCDSVRLRRGYYLLPLEANDFEFLLKCLLVFWVSPPINCRFKSGSLF